MANILCKTEEVDVVVSESGNTVAGVRVTCGKCGNYEDSGGTEVRSISRSCTFLKKSCPNGENNFYYTKETEHLLFKTPSKKDPEPPKKKTKKLAATKKTPLTPMETIEKIAKKKEEWGDPETMRRKNYL